MLFSASVILITGYFLKTDPQLIESRLKAGPAAERESGQKIIQAFTGIFFILLFIIAGIDHRSGWSAVPVYGVIVGDLLTVTGFVIVFLTFKENRFTSAIIEVLKRPDGCHDRSVCIRPPPDVCRRLPSPDCKHPSRSDLFGPSSQLF